MDCPHCHKPLPEGETTPPAVIEKECEGYRLRLAAATPEDVVRLQEMCDEIRAKWAATPGLDESRPLRWPYPGVSAVIPAGAWRVVTDSGGVVWVRVELSRVPELRGRFDDLSGIRILAADVEYADAADVSPVVDRLPVPGYVTDGVPKWVDVPRGE